MQKSSIDEIKWLVGVVNNAFVKLLLLDSDNQKNLTACLGA